MFQNPSEINKNLHKYTGIFWNHHESPANPKIFEQTWNNHGGWGILQEYIEISGISQFL